MAAFDLNTGLRGELLEHEPLADHTSWRVGGPAQRMYKPADIDDLALFLSQLDADEPLLWVGLGSNLLVRDGGVRGTVILTSGLLNGLHLENTTTVRAEAGVACNKVARFCAQHHLVGAEFLAGIPGTVGGALAMNAGAFGGETWTWVNHVETIDRHGERRVRTPAEYQISYREIHGPQGEWFVAAHFTLNSGDGAAAQQRIKGLLAERNRKQPTAQPSCGSVFRNPTADYAARLIEACGLKGQCIGAACVSEKHANFIVNMGDARAADIEALIAKVQHTVAQTHGVQLKPEVHIVGVPAA